ncbi:MAG TPA: RdgB/HAM1 family non-canonical purine NTP pyrophosphatase [Burkholderiaceae bacterium]|nr:RdgB/HAM1 family non-canonical purine NTP pyrophosphatase [Burkholderiaceae bacterium]
MTRRIVLASSNAGKLREFRALLADLDFEVIAQGELGIEAAEEPHLTFVENALAKARHAAVRSGLPALADDSGLCVAALGGAPGVHSARFSGSNASDESNNAELLRRLHGHAERRAHYTCVLVAVAAADDPEPLIAEARWPGTILAQPRGVGGFGYDPLFLLPELGLSAAELAPDEKNRISHRGQAMRELARRFAAWS